MIGPGSELGGFAIESIAGRGGMGVVYRATELTLDRIVALKLIAPSLAGDPDFRARFLRESRAAASIEHPNVLPIYYAGEHGDEPDSGHRRREAEAEGEDEDDSEADAVEGDGAEQHDEGRRAGQDPGRDADAEDAP